MILDCYLVKYFFRVTGRKSENSKNNRINKMSRVPGELVDGKELRYEASKSLAICIDVAVIASHQAQGLYFQRPMQVRRQIEHTTQRLGRERLYRDVEVLPLTR